MKLFAKRRAREAQERRIAAIQAACDHEWELVEEVEGQDYFTFRCAILPDGSSVGLKYACRKCDKVRWERIDGELFSS